MPKLAPSSLSHDLAGMQGRTVVTTPRADGVASIEEALSTEFALTLLRVERMRATLVAGFFAAVAAALALRLALATGTDPAWSWVEPTFGVRLVVTLALLAAQVFVRHLLVRRIEARAPLSEAAWYVMATAEIFALAAVAYFIQSVSPIPEDFGYEVRVVVLLLFVSLSVLRLRAGLSVLTGLLAGGAYLVIASTFGPGAGSVLFGGIPEGYFWGAGMIAGSGGVAGALAWQLRHQVLRLIRTLAERHLLEREAAQAADAERHRIGRDLHDDLGARLTGIAMLCRGLVHRAQKGRPVEASRLEDVALEAEASVEEARRLAQGLSPLDLVDGHLAHALRSLAKRTEDATAIAVTLHTTGPLDDALDVLRPDQREHLYRIAQEAVANAAKHAQPTEIALTLAATDEGLQLSVRDNGGGFVGASEEEGERLGLRTMRQRARLIGATLRIQAGPNHGTRVECVVPRDTRPAGS
ncbi:MAG: sensor histidine kinase [Bacteroidota bacterium]